jgi:hypothetical protein
MVWIDFDLECDPFFVEVRFDTEDEELLVFFDFGVLNVEGLLATDFFGLGLRAEESGGWMVVMGGSINNGRIDRGFSGIDRSNRVW